MRPRTPKVRPRGPCLYGQWTINKVLWYVLTYTNCLRRNDINGVRLSHSFPLSFSSQLINTRMDSLPFTLPSLLDQQRSVD